MPANKKTAAHSLCPETAAWLATAPGAALDALLHPLRVREIHDAAYRVAIQRNQLVSAPDLPQDMPLRIRIAIQAADLRCRTATGKPLDRVREYLHHRRAGDPGIRAIYTHYGTWPYALLAARDAEHAGSAKRRTTGGDRRTRAFTEAQCERAVLVYAEAHAGHLPTHGDWQRWTNGRPELPSDSQIRSRTNDQSGRTWDEVRIAARRRALTEPGWPLTRQRILLDKNGSS